MTRTKAEFRATRERVGITQAALAEAMGVSQRSVRYWEDPRQTMRQPPEEAWAILDAALDRQRQVLGYALAKVEKIANEAGHAPSSVRLSYWASQSDWEASHRDSEDDFHRVNANNMAMAIILEERGIAVEWMDGNPARP